jgi:molybdenum cofactor cytidylyltransferase
MNAVEIMPIVLAAGDSRRMGTPKALLPLADGTFLTVILDKLARLGLPVPTVVLGNHARLIMPSLEGRAVRVLINPHPEQGQISSMQLGLGSVGECSGCLVWPVDQPAVREEVVGQLIESFGRSEALIAMPLCGGRRGHPAIFRSRMCRELLAVAAEAGPKDLIRGHAGETVLLETDDPGTVDDIDTPADYRSLLDRIRNAR